VYLDEKPKGLLVVEPDSGEPLAGASIIGRAAWTDGAVCVFDRLIAPGILTPAHRHGSETQAAYVVSGKIGFWVDGEEAIVSAGGYVVRPAGAAHALWNAGDEPAHMLEITSPAEPFQSFMLELTRLAADAAPFDDIVALANRYGTFMAPDVTAELCERHGLAAGTGYAGASR
jgi:mannose-6-phosphate isomerase-like protein (cupin superfamily)